MEVVDGVELFELTAIECAEARACRLSEDLQFGSLFRLSLLYQPQAPAQNLAGVSGNDQTRPVCR